MKYKGLYTIIITFTIMMVGCKKEFIERPSLDGTTVTNYFNTAEEVRGLTSTLYSGLPWSGFEGGAMDAICDLMAGNEYANWGDDNIPYVSFSFAATSSRISDSWKAFYKVGGWTSEYMNTLELKKQIGGNAAFIDPAIAECHFLRGTVYFYIARIWGDVPIITEPGKIALSGNFNLPRYLKSDVLRFALEELKLAEAGLPETDPQRGRVTKYSAKGMMAKLYLYIKDYENAKIKAQEVISSGKYDLFPDYAALFNTSKNNNNIEALFSIQHQATGNPWGSGNQMQPMRGPGNLSVSGAPMWQVFYPSMDLIRNGYESGDLRRKGSIMEHGWSMPNWKPQVDNKPNYNVFMANGYVYDTARSDNDGGIKNAVHANIAKYVTGPGLKYGGELVAMDQNTGINFMMLRYADILLIYGEAVLGDQASTSDASALAAFNRVRYRAGLSNKTFLTKDIIMKERRAEFAFEGDYWFDIQRQGFAKAKQIIEAQNRGSYTTPATVTFSENQMYLPIPAGEILQDPELAKPAVPYYK